MGTGRVKVQATTYAASETPVGSADSAYKPPKVYEEPKPAATATATATAAEEETSSKEEGSDSDSDEDSL